MNSAAVSLQAAPGLTLRVDRGLWTQISDHIGTTHQEEAGALLVRNRPATRPDLLIIEGFLPVPDEFVTDRRHGLRYDGRFHLRVAREAAERGVGALIVHEHPHQDPPIPSEEDTIQAERFITFMRRRAPDASHGYLVVGDETITGIVDVGGYRLFVQRVVEVGTPLRVLRHEAPSTAPVDVEDRQLLAIGDAGQHKLAQSVIAIVGISGGGSHAQQQFVHAGPGEIIPVDFDVVDRTNLRRVVTSTAADVDRTRKVDLVVRLAAQVRPHVKVTPVFARFPSAEALKELRRADVIIGCVDGWDVRDDLNTFALEHRIPYIDIGATITAPVDDLPMRATGQVAVVLPGGPCLRCMGLVTDANVAASRAQRQGYANKVPDPQVVSINGTLASEAVTAAMMLLAGINELKPHRRYKFPPGILKLVRAEQPSCPACTAAGLARREATPAAPAEGPARFWKRWIRRFRRFPR